jgi:hypothetical protein
MEDMDARFAAAVQKIPTLYDALMNGDFIAKIDASLKEKVGVYAFFENGQAVHIGRTRNLLRRLRGHGSRSHYSATFVFKETRRVLGRSATYKPAGSRAELMKDTTFLAEFTGQLDRFKEFRIRFLAVSDPVEQYLLELYAHLALGLSLAEFDTH